MVIDEAIPPLDFLIIEGGIHTAPDASLNFVLDVNYIIIAGRLAIGWEHEPFNGTAKIILRGQHSTPKVPLDEGPELGSKFMGKLSSFTQGFFRFFIGFFNQFLALTYNVKLNFAANLLLLWQCKMYVCSTTKGMYMYMINNHK